VVVLSIASTLQVPGALAAGSRDAEEFHALFRSGLTGELPHSNMPYVHMLPDEHIQKAAEADSLQAAMDEVKLTSLVKLLEHTKTSTNSVHALNAEKILTKKPVTIVIVPGFLGEFIENRGFEEVFAPIDQETATAAATTNLDRGTSTQVRDERTADFLDKIAAAKKVGNGNAVDVRKVVRTIDFEHKVDLSDVIHMGAIKSNDGKILAKVVLFFTKRMSLESIGDLEGPAAIFNRRLAKYLSLTGPQDLVLVGYSRGTPLGLEMLAQAKKQNLGWLASVKAMVSLGGVSWGSSLVDIYDRPSDAKESLDSLDGLANVLFPSSIAFPTNTAHWGHFLTKMALFTRDKAKHAEMPAEEFQGGLFENTIDLGAVGSLAKSVYSELGLTSPFSDYADNINRFKRFTKALVAGIRGMGSNTRIDWWKSHELPKSVQYYTITAAMANPGSRDAEEKTIFRDMGIGYSMSADDKSLLQNSLDYTHESGVPLNDSQVAIAQAMLLPNFAEKLNPANAGLKTSFLGTCGTHHWGLALRKVSVKTEHANPFPREALLKALAAKVVLDQSRRQ